MAGRESKTMNNFLSGEELEAFVKKVEKLKAEGLPTYAIMSRLGVPRSTLVTRLNRYREAKALETAPDEA